MPTSRPSTSLKLQRKRATPMPVEPSPGFLEIGEQYDGPALPLILFTREFRLTPSPADECDTLCPSQVSVDDDRGRASYSELCTAARKLGERAGVWTTWPDQVGYVLPVFGEYDDAPGTYHPAASPFCHGLLCAFIEGVADVIGEVCALKVLHPHAQIDLLFGELVRLERRGRRDLDALEAYRACHAIYEGIRSSWGALQDKAQDCIANMTSAGLSAEDARTLVALKWHMAEQGK